MGLIARKYNSTNTKFNHIKGSGLLQVPAVCRLKKCIPKPIPIPKSPVPQTLARTAATSLTAIKQSPKDNKWTLGKASYPDFNSFWVNIPKGSYIILKANG